MFVGNGRFQHCNPVCDLPVKPLERRTVWKNQNTDIHFYTNLHKFGGEFNFILLQCGTRKRIAKGKRSKGQLIIIIFW